MILAVASLAAYLALGAWSPWKDSNRPGLWLGLTGVCAYAFVWFAVPLAR